MSDPVTEATKEAVRHEVDKATDQISPAMTQVRRSVFGWVLDQVRNHPHFIAVLLFAVAGLELELWLHRAGLDGPLLRLLGLL